MNKDWVDLNTPGEAKLVKKPKFKFPKVKFNGKYYRKRVREIKKGNP